MSPDLISSFLKQVSPDTQSLTVWGLQAIAIYVTDLLLKKIKITSFWGPIFLVIALSFINSHIWDAALFFQIPNTLTSQALTILLVNGIIFWILVKILPGIEIEGFSTAIIAPVIFTICNLIITYLVENVDPNEVYQYISQIFSEIKDFATDSASNKAVSATGV